MTDPNIALRAAKVRLDRAARDCLQNIPGAAQRADAALAEVAHLQALLQAGRNRCTALNCDRITLHGGLCDKHRKPDIWGESRRILDELEAQQK